MKIGDMPTVSVIMPTYNHACFIKEAIDSVLKQMYAKLELIIVDNFSDDETQLIVNGYLAKDNRVKYFRFANQGVIASSRNYGVSQAIGEYVAFLDSDDRWRETKLRHQLQYFEKGIVAVSSQFNPIGEVNRCYNHLNKLLNKRVYRDFSYQECLLNNPVMTSSLLMKKKDFEHVGGFDQARKFICIEDWELWLRACKLLKGKLRVINTALIDYRIVVSTSRNHVLIALHWLKVLSKHYTLNYINDQQLNIARSQYLLNIGFVALKYEKSVLSCLCFLKAFHQSKVLKVKVISALGALLAKSPLFFRRWLIKLFQYIHFRMKIFK